MNKISAQFLYITGIKRDVFTNASIVGSWDANGNNSKDWTSSPMKKIIHTDGCPAFTATMQFNDDRMGMLFNWGVTLNDSTLWGIAAEVDDINSNDKFRTFRLTTSISEVQKEYYYLTNYHRLGANKFFSTTNSQGSVRFGVWAPNAENVEVVFGNPKSGYIANDGYGIDSTMQILKMSKGENGVWLTDTKDKLLSKFSDFDHKPYMYRIKKKGGRVAYRTDLYSRCQIGSGTFDPTGSHYEQGFAELDGSVGCSVIIDSDTVVSDFKDASSMTPKKYISAEEFWQGDSVNRAKLPKRVEDIIIYELHVGALGFGKKDSNHQNLPGDITDAMNLLDYLSELGVNCIELLPMAEFEGWASWGYGTSHYFAIEYSAGGRDQMKHFVRECHRRGIAVILDVVYNHYDPNGERAEWMYDSDEHPENIYYWYEGQPSDYSFPEGGYIDNMSTGYSPSFWNEMVRQMFISSAAALMEDFHVDGFRLDQTTSMHSYNRLHLDGKTMGKVNMSGAKFLTEFNTTLKLINPDVILTAEDHSEWDRVTMPLNMGGMGFDASWYAEFYHNLTGASGNRTQNARLIKLAGYGNNYPLNMAEFSGSLSWASTNKIVYHESHDEAGNSENSARTIVVASNYAPLVDGTRIYAEARCRFAFGMAMLSPGTPMFLFGEEVGAFRPYRYNDFVNNKDDLIGLRDGDGKFLFRFYSDLIRFRENNKAIRSHSIDIVHVHNENRVIAFRRWGEHQEFLIAASLNNSPFGDGYLINNIRSSDGAWKEVFNSDWEGYRGGNVGNSGGFKQSHNESINIVIPSCGFVVFEKL